MPIDREQQAIDEMASTTGPRWAQWSLVVGFCALLVVPGSLHLVTSPEPLLRTAVAIPASLARAWTDGDPFATSRHTLKSIDAFEAELRNGSPLAQQLRPASQTAMFELLGVGNTQVRPGVDLPRSERIGRTLYFQPALHHVMGPPFLSRAWHVKRRRGGDAWAGAVEPDPRPAVRHFAEDLRSRGVELIVLPIPVKASVDFLALDLPRRLVNPSWEPFLASLDRLGVGGPDVLGLLSRRKGAQFLETDTHWRPEAMDEVAAAVAEALVARGVQQGVRLARDTPKELEGTGDLADLLGVWPGTITPDVVQVAPLKAAPDRSKARVLVLGDSFAGVYADPNLGFGDHGGFADALAHHLGQPVDAIVVNAGGAWQTRKALADDAARLDAIDVVVWMFTARELSLGDWRVVRLPEVEAQVDPRWVGTDARQVRGVVRALAPTADPRESPYPDQVVAMAVDIDGVARGAAGSGAWLMAWGLLDRQPQPASRLAVGDSIWVDVRAFSQAPPQALTAGRSELTERPSAVPVLWVEQWRTP